MELILIPFFGAIAVFLLKQKAQAVALIAATGSFLVALFRWSNFQQSAQFFELANYSWIPSAGINFHLGADGVSLSLVLLTNLLIPLIIWATKPQTVDNQPRFFALILVMQAALIGVFTALDGFVFYLFWEMALIPIWFICAIWGGENRIRITLKFFIYTFVGSLLMLAALLFLYLKTTDVLTGGHSFSWSALQEVSLSANEGIWVFAGFFIAFAVKIPIFPFHTWQPDTYTDAPSAGTMLLSGIMLKMGAYGLLRWLIPLAPEGYQSLAEVVKILALAGIIYASIIAIKQTDLKRLIAYSSIAHVGLISLGILCWNFTAAQGAMVQMVNHGILVFGLFFFAQILEDKTGTRDLRQLGGLAQRMPKLAALSFTILLGSMAVPFTNGFIGEFLLLKGIFENNLWNAVFAGTSIIFGAAYLLRVFQLVMFGETKSAVLSNMKDIKGSELAILIIVAALVIVLGIFAQPVLDLNAPAIEQLISKIVVE